MDRSCLSTSDIKGRTCPAEKTSSTLVVCYNMEVILLDENFDWECLIWIKPCWSSKGEEELEVKWRKRNVTVKACVEVDASSKVPGIFGCCSNIQESSMSHTSPTCFAANTRQYAAWVDMLGMFRLTPWFALQFPCLVVQSPAASYQLLHFFRYRRHL